MYFNNLIKAMPVTTLSLQLLVAIAHNHRRINVNIPTSGVSTGPWSWDFIEEKYLGDYEVLYSCGYN